MNEQRKTRDAKAEAAREKLAEWLEVWSLDRALTGDGPSGETVAFRPARRRETRPPREGDIRLLAPAGAEDLHTGRPIYAVLLEGPSGHMQWIPFGRFSVPALPTEWITGLRAEPLRVLCFWNARVVAEGREPASWPVRRLPPHRLAHWKRVEQILREGRQPPARLAGRIGPPLPHPADPRHLYVHEERERLDGFFIPAPCRMDAPAPDGGLRYDEDDAFPRLLAAEPCGEYRTRTDEQPEEDGHDDP